MRFQYVKYTFFLTKLTLKPNKREEPEKPHAKACGFSNVVVNYSISFVVLPLNRAMCFLFDINSDIAPWNSDARVQEIGYMRNNPERELKGSRGNMNSAHRTLTTHTQKAHESIGSNE